MLKMFQAQVSPGGTPEYWDVNWESAMRHDVLSDDAICENTPIFPLMKEKIDPKRLFLEGGCGHGQWVSYFHRRGYRVVGVDFAPRAVERFRRVFPDADVRVGDIMRLPFGNGEVHAYYSGGVVEHDESGPEPALREARRVLGNDGWFLCSVPDVCSLRNFLFRREVTERPDLSPPLVVKRVRETRPEPPPPGMHFFQYVFSEGEFASRLEQAGFEIVDSFGYSMVWGLMEIPGVTRIVDKATGREQRTDSSPPSALSSIPAPAVETRHDARHAVKQVLKRVLVREDRTVPVVGPAIRFATEHLSNMRMYVARPNPAARRAS